MAFSDRMKEARLAAGMTQEKLAQAIGVAKSTYTGYEKGNSEPNIVIQTRIMEALGVDANFLFQDEVKKRKDTTASPWEMENIIKKYRALDEHGKEMVTLAIECETRRMVKPAYEEKIVEVFPFRRYIQSASAGIGDFSDDDSYDMIDLVKRPPAGASFIIAVDGDSMEPTYNDGDLLFVRAQETIRVGEIGLFVIAGHLYIKEAGEDGLISHNEAYGVIYPPDDTPAKVEGKVIGVCTPDYLQ